MTVNCGGTCDIQIGNEGFSIAVWKKFGKCASSDSVKWLRRFSEGQDDLFKKDIYNFYNFSLTAF